MVKFKSKNLIEIYIKNNLGFCFYIKGHPERAGIDRIVQGGVGLWSMKSRDRKSQK